MHGFRDHRSLSFAQGEKDEPCFICGKESDRLLLTENGFRIKKCKKCKLVYLSNPPSQAEINRYYENLYVSSNLENHLVQGVNQALFDQLIDMLVKNIGGGNLLEIGAGFGHFLQSLQLRTGEAFSMHAVEPDLMASRHIKENYPFVNVANTGIEQCSFSDGTFDVAIGIGSFEHIRDQNSLFANCYRLLKSGGLLIFCVPNIELFLRFSLVQPFYKVEFLAPQHFYDYSPASISAIARKYHFLVDHIQVSAPIAITKHQLLAKAVKVAAKLTLKIFPPLCLFGGGIIGTLRKK